MAVVLQARLTALDQDNVNIDKRRAFLEPCMRPEFQGSVASQKGNREVRGPENMIVARKGYNEWGTCLLC
jgi:hypothetical protein